MTHKGHAVPAKRRARFLAIMVLSLLFICTLLASLRYYKTLQETVKAESVGHLQEISEQIARSAGQTIDDNFSVLGTVSSALRVCAPATLDDMYRILSDQQEHWGFEGIFPVDARGTAYGAGGSTVLLSSDAYLREAIVSRERAMSTSEMLGGTECVVFAIPLDGVTVEGIAMSALVGTYNLATFDRMLSITAFDGAGYGHIIRRDGTVVIRSSSPSAPQTGYNMLSSFAAAPFAGSVTADKVSADIANGIRGQAELTLGGVPLCMAYTPLAAQEWCLLTFVPVAVATAKSAFFLRITLLIGVLLALVFSVLLLMLVFTFYRHKRKLEELAYVDTVTGGNTIQRFYMQAAALLAAANDTQYAAIYTNIGKFKLLNEQLGRDACDTILKTASGSIQQALHSDECMGRLFADNFCVLMHYTDEKTLAQQLLLWNENYLRALKDRGGAQLPLTLEIGVYVVDDRALPIPDMIDRAKLALRETPRKLGMQLQYTLYDDTVRRRLLREKQLEDRMERALQSGEFQVYLQPKYRTGSKRIGGAEALARWKSADEGMIFPDEFIPIFEKNGFIAQLDCWVFEQVCKTLRAWLDAGRTPVPISVNCSRLHLKTPGFLRQYFDIAQRYKVPPSLLEIELTENVVFEDVLLLTQIIDEIHTLGFHCSMDDFGSGYSSLNLIKDIPVDVLKLDRVFFLGSEKDPARVESIIACILTMARALAIETVAEGVEEHTQVEMLERLGCDYIQGYYFAKPMPIAEFEALAFPEGTSSKP